MAFPSPRAAGPRISVMFRSPGRAGSRLLHLTRPFRLLAVYFSAARVSETGLGIAKQHGRVLLEEERVLHAA